MPYHTLTAGIGRFQWWCSSNHASNTMLKRLSAIVGGLVVVGFMVNVPASADDHHHAEQKTQHFHDAGDAGIVKTLGAESSLLTLAAVQERGDRRRGDRRSDRRRSDRGDRRADRRRGDRSRDRNRRSDRGDRRSDRRGDRRRDDVRRGDRRRGEGRHAGKRDDAHRQRGHRSTQPRRDHAHRGDRRHGDRYRRDRYRGDRRHADRRRDARHRDARRRDRRYARRDYHTHNRGYNRSGYSRRAYRGKRYAHGFRSSRGHGYFCVEHNLFHYFLGFDPLGFYRVANYGRTGYRYASSCYPVEKIDYFRGRKALVRAILCYDSYDRPYLKKGSRYAIKYY